mgnify:CR=1 FL=1
MSKTTQGITEYEVEYGDMLNEDDYGDITVDCYTSRVLAVARYRQLVKQNKYDSVDLVERSGVVDGCCACSDDIMSYRKENPSYDEDEIDGPIFDKYQDDYIMEKFGDEYDWSIQKEPWSTFFHDVLFSDGENTINGVWVGLREDRDAEEEEEDICSTCGKDYEECETCECPNDAKCLMLCKIEKEETQKRRKFMEVMATPVVGDNLTAEEIRIKIKELGLTAEELYKKWILEWS